MLKKVINNIGLLVGICGLIIFMFGLTETNINHKNLIVFFATFFLFLSAIIQKEPFFSGLQGIAFVSATMVFFNFSQIYNLAIFVLLAVVFSIIYFSKYKINIARVCAFIGLVALCFGILLGRNEPMVVCGIVLAVYAIFSIREGYSVGWVFLILNLLFSVVAANALFGFI
ncbi:MFS transporter [Francisella philomiragia]|uniref:MFS transporter n=1 Tax=Francisella philomiragia TaxID=28110 RepID=UPI0019050D5B|nr:MFS transporter [Francisella philomiragia]MBK2266704.1 MFS transporter [Francisella philomiragia]MBK2278128.1 MFS transporter [Francisella philomiragia]MBK2285984.1 MFS transporter [Francisella philomiragia]MBK2287987.1 MFS transporter [Francisella philomiragia]MBK2289943.1 MFS transporter [Francisella philomiragia]